MVEGERSEKVREMRRGALPLDILGSSLGFGIEREKVELIQLSGNGEHKSGDLHIEVGLIIHPLHDICALHLTDLRCEYTIR